MAGFKNHEVNGPGEVGTDWTLGQKLATLVRARAMRGEALENGDVEAAWGWHWIVISALIALGLCMVA